MPGSTCPLLSFDLQTTFAIENGMVRISVPAALSLGRCHASEKQIYSSVSEQQFWKVIQFRKVNSWLFQDKSTTKIEWKCNKNSGCQSSLVKCCTQSCFYNSIHNINAWRLSVCILSDVYNYFCVFDFDF